jgi:hypothetical protein
MTLAVLQKMRIASGLSYMKIAVAAKLHNNTVLRAFGGEHVSVETIEAIEKALHKALVDQRCRADELLQKVAVA